MVDTNAIATALETIAINYQSSFTAKTYNDENDDYDCVMDLFGISPTLKRENRQYWGRELGMCWQLFVCEVVRQTRDDYGPALRFGADEPCDLVFGQTAIDTKYRIGSGDSGTLKKFKQYGALLKGKGYNPVFLIVRKDNLSAAITACRKGGWAVHTGESTFAFIQEYTGFDLQMFLRQRAGAFQIDR